MQWLLTYRMRRLLLHWTKTGSLQSLRLYNYTFTVFFISTYYF